MFPMHDAPGSGLSRPISDPNTDVFLNDAESILKSSPDCVCVQLSETDAFQGLSCPPSRYTQPLDLVTPILGHDVFCLLDCST